MKNFYDTLGVAKNASDDDIKKAFRKLAQQYHPDKKGGDEKKFKEISEAYSVLSDATRRAEYDRYGQSFNGAGPQGGGASGGFGGASGFEGFDFSQFTNGGGVEFDLGDMFGEFFGGGGRGQRRGQKKGRDISVDVQITFKESLFGVERVVLINKIASCETCKGTGGKTAETTKCATCDGKGQIQESRRTILGTFAQVRECDTCSGVGTIPKEKCGTCRGQKVYKQEEKITMNIPAGIQSEEMLRMNGKGEAVAGGVPGDLYIRIHVKEDAHFARSGNDIVHPVEVKLSEALLGKEQVVHAVDGEVTVHIPAGVDHGETVRVKGRGFPIRGGNRGDLIVVVSIHITKKLSKKAKELINELHNEGL